MCNTVSMGVRFAVLTALILCSLHLTPAWAQAAPLPPRPFSLRYVESLKDILQLEQADVAQLEPKLAANPEDFQTRLKLMAYYQRADRSSHEGDHVKRIRSVLWLIEYHPDSEILHSFVSRFSQGDLASAEYRRAVALWNAAAKAKPMDAAVQWNAASSFEDLDQELYLRYLEATAAADPNHPFALRPLAHLYALSILKGGPLTSRAHAGLDATKNVWVLGNAAYMLQSQYNQTLQTGLTDRRAAELAERYFLRAKALDPKLDRQTILPQLDLPAIAHARQDDLRTQNDWQAHAEEANGKIPRLAPSAFSELPAAVAGVLRARNCTVPQPTAGGTRHNVIRGEFFTKGEAGWAVFCSVNHSTALLAFRNDRDTKPETITTSEDRGYLQAVNDGKFVYSREINMVGRDFILEHYRAYGGPEPPRIDHQGIDDAFLEKASVTWYFHNGKWLRLTGSD